MEMKNRDKFVAQKNEDAEKLFKKIYTTERKAVKNIYDIITHQIGTEYEPMKEKVALGALVRCCMCIESMLVLSREGYVGSANALLRQAYEFLCWAKLAIDNKDEQILIKLHDDFYNYEKEKKADKLQNYYKNVKFLSDSDDISEEDIILLHKNYKDAYAYLTHATVYAQQCSFPTHDYYELLIDFYRELTIWIFSLYEVALSYHIIRVVDGQYKTEWDEEEAYGLLNYMEEMKSIDLCKMVKFFRGMNEEKMVCSFRDVKWELK